MIGWLLKDVVILNLNFLLVFLVFEEEKSDGIKLEMFFNYNSLLVFFYL